MTAKAMTPSQQQRFIRICEDQGIKVTRTKKGLFLRFPDGSSTVQHFTNSDVKSTQNQIARFRRAGMTHPEDPRGPKDLPKYITEGTITPASRQKIIDYLNSRGMPEVIYQKDVTKDLNMDPGWVNRALFHTGFRPGKAKNAKVGRPWYTPAELLEGRTEDVQVTVIHDPVVGEPVQDETTHVIIGQVDPVLNEALAQIVDDDEPTPPAEVEEMPIYDEGTVAAQAGVVEKIIGREFIDTHDSWIVDPKELFGPTFERFHGDALRMLDALGLEFEVRVWRKS